jgi:hypothetical protein
MTTLATAARASMCVFGLLLAPLAPGGTQPQLIPPLRPKMSG